MLSEIHKEKAQFHYYQALIHIRALEEKAASADLLAARETILNGRHFTELQTADIQIIAEDLTEAKFNALHGDYGYRLKSQWVPAALMDTVEKHHAKFENQFGAVHDDKGRPLSWEQYAAKKENMTTVIAPNFDAA